jgi:hypothetical protein
MREGERRKVREQRAMTANAWPKDEVRSETRDKSRRVKTSQEPSSRYVSVAAAVLGLSRPGGRGGRKSPPALPRSSISLSRHISLSGIVEQS